jgi:teichuronic acid biosynthesis glycosyltransferase TuaG
MSKQSKPLVSIIVPVYNAGRFIDETIQTVLDQAYTNWELLLVDDKSTDESVKLIKPYVAKDKRIKLLSNKQNSGAAVSRNKGIDDAQGRYIAFLDADDLWAPTKLEKQVAFMLEKDCAFSFTGYEFANASGRPNGKKVHVPATITYKQALKNTTISTITVMFDTTKLAKSDIRMPAVESEDTATWWCVLKKINCAYGLNHTLSVYRRCGATLSSNKIESAKRTWKLYRHSESLGLLQSSYYFGHYVVNASMRRL